MSAYSLKDIHVNCREKYPLKTYGLNTRIFSVGTLYWRRFLKWFIEESGLHRPGLAMAGFTSVYSSHQIQVVGHTEWNYLESLGSEKRREIFSNLSQFHSPLWVITHEQKPHQELLDMCNAQGTPIFVPLVHV